MNKRGLILSLSVTLLATSFLVACGGKDPNAGSGKSKTLIYGRGADSVGLDPSQQTDGESLKVTKQVLDTLVDYKDDSTEVVPGLAEKWEKSKDGLTWTFHLKQGVKFHDGTPFNAEAVVFNFERWMDKKNPYHKGDYPYYGYMFGGFKGDPGHVMKAVTAVDANTVKFELAKPQGPFLNNLAMSSFGIGSPEAIKKDPEGVKFNQSPVGTGPFKFVEWKKNDSITLAKNPDYYEKGLPKMDKVIFKSIPDNAARFTALKSGDIDMMDGLNPDDAKLVEADKKLQLKLRPGMNVGYLALNTTKKPFDKPEVRQAINLATNKKGIIESFFAGYAKPAINPMPDVVWGFNKETQDYEYNLEKAKSLLEKAGYPNGFDVEFYAMTEPRPYMPNGKKVAEFMQEDLKKIGINAKIVTYDWQTYKDRVGKGEHQMALYGWTGDNGDPDNFLYVLLDKDNTRTPDAGNVAFYKNDALHDTLIKAQQSTDQKARTDLYQKAQEIIKKDAPWVPLVHATVPEAARAEITGWIPHPTGSDKLLNVSIGK
ncbi:ABC transporter substrate-binding protein [Baia soyae]|uniref:Peptide/nickel transport system substrate-binding protein n=1 Tax=Baia soyae TaxID=1544746 RepID=A0A4R2SGA4_9BACL|nr:ABC transporter substrate-binding protein [Baia soyae]TCP70480.1 peptide/nickel transport system substrate-binding protein [Baia soyae]